MRKTMRNCIAGMLSVLFLITPCYAIGNYSYTTTQTESYVASTATGNSTVYYGAVPNTNYYVTPGYYQRQADYIDVGYYPTENTNPNNEYNTNYNTPTYQASTNYNCEHCKHQNNIKMVANAGYYVSNTVDTPQSYNKTTVTTNSFRDERPNIDKNLDRAGKVVGILGGAAILGLGAAALIKAL